MAGFACLFLNFIFGFLIFTDLETNKVCLCKNHLHALIGLNPVSASLKKHLGNSINYCMYPKIYSAFNMFSQCLNLQDLILSFSRNQH